MTTTGATIQACADALNDLGCVLNDLAVRADDNGAHEWAGTIRGARAQIGATIDLLVRGGAGYLDAAWAMLDGAREFIARWRIIIDQLDAVRRTAHLGS